MPDLPWKRLVPYGLAAVLGGTWAAREVARAQDAAKAVASQTIPLDRVAMKAFEDRGRRVGQIGIYVTGETPTSRDFVTGRFVLEPGQTPHPPHRHVEEEVMIVETGRGEIVCDGNTTQVGPGSVMYTTPNAPHGITNTGSEPLIFYFVKWTPKNGK